MCYLGQAMAKENISVLHEVKNEHKKGIANKRYSSVNFISMEKYAEHATILRIGIWHETRIYKIN